MEEKKLEEEKEQLKIPEEVKKEVARIQESLKEFKKALLKKFPWVSAIGILPPQAAGLVEEEEEVEKKPEEKLIHVLILLPEEKIKQLPRLKLEAIQLVKDIKPKVWLHVKLIPELWEICFEGKHALMEAFSMSFPLYDKGILGALRVASIHKTLTLKKFERYVVSYVLAGSLVRGEATKTSDIDVFVVIDDTDVRRMSRYELKEKLRAIIYSYALEASKLAGVENKLSPQIYILTEFWDAVKDAHPVIFTFIRDGVPLYDKGAFMPWKLLLKMGKIKPSPEAIDTFMSLGDKVAKRVEAKLNEIATEDIYWGVITPSQALLMLYGVPPPTPKEIVKVMEEIFVKKEKLLEPKYISVLDRIVTLYKRYEHEEVKAISGKEIDELLKESSEYISRLKQLMEQIEVRVAQKEIVQAYSTVFELLQSLVGKGNEQELLKSFEQEWVKQAKVSPRSLFLLKQLAEIKKKKKPTKEDLAEAHRAAHELTSTIIELKEKQERTLIEKAKIDIFYKEGKEKAELIPFKEAIFLVKENEIKKLIKGKLVDSSKEELTKALKKEKPTKRISQELFTELKKLLGPFELAF